MAISELHEKVPLQESTGNDGLDQQYGGGHTGKWVSRLPPSAIPYIQLARLSPPVGLILIYIPHFLGILHSAILQQGSSPAALRTAAVLLLGGSLFCSNGAHSWNDLIDTSVDKLVARTRNRPIARGAILPRAAFVFTATQAVSAAVFLLGFPKQKVAAYWAMPNIAATMYYPYAKRHTYFAQFVLGFCLSWGVFMGALAMDADPLESYSTTFLFLACILWTVIYDTIYAHQDVKDDTKINLKSMAVLCGNKTKYLLWVLLGGMLALLSASGYLAQMGPWYYILAVGGCFGSLGIMILNVDLGDSLSCWLWFRYGFWLAGGSMTIGLLSEYLLRL
ncbi:UbiA prenyltransferase [Daldinia decipiens]|uniref:UbiA prenyltransferase n=1 Tax=Daldinia decipiens TaxID=326647 RepID=UPI0020C1CFE1|nr:UbiA prenyltransferase [Daldinia decipiens]KAI1657066.1 UbiA prenyltransferase [Daldinia decipiens]